MICKEDYLSFAIGDRDGIFGSRNYAVAKLDAVKGNTKDRHDDAQVLKKCVGFEKFVDLEICVGFKKCVG